jgi:hypothetical protein
MSINVQRRARRIEQLERSKAEYGERKLVNALAKEQATARQAAWAKWTFGLVKLSLPDDPEIEDWKAPEWLESYGEDCGPVQWEVVWTISYVGISSI